MSSAEAMAAAACLQRAAAAAAADAASSAAAADTSAIPGLDAACVARITGMNFAFTISSCQLADMPIVYASDAFFEMTGYSREEVVGRNCRFLQGPATERRKVMEIRDAIREERCCQVCLTNYRKDGSQFLNQFFLSPIKDDQGQTVYYVGIQTDVSGAAKAGLLADAMQLREQQAAVALGQAAGCRMCDTIMQPQEVQQQLAAAAAQQQQPAAPVSPPPQQPGSADASSEDEEADVIRAEAAHACEINGIIQQSHPHADCCLLPSSLLQALLSVQQSFVLADPRRPDCPIVHASPQFLAMTGYSREEVVGRNCRFLQGPGTDPQHVQQLRDAMAAVPPRAVTVTLLNYTKPGRPFWNCLHISPVRDAEGSLEYFIGVQLDVTHRCPDEAQQLRVAGLPPAPTRLSLSDRMAHNAATGAVRVACRSLSGGSGGLRRSIDDGGLPRRGYSRRLSLSSGASLPSVGSGPSGASGGSFSQAADAAVTSGADGGQPGAQLGV